MTLIKYVTAEILVLFQMSEDENFCDKISSSGAPHLFSIIVLGLMWKYKSCTHTLTSHILYHQ